MKRSSSSSSSSSLRAVCRNYFLSHASGSTSSSTTSSSASHYSSRSAQNYFVRSMHGTNYARKNDGYIDWRTGTAWDSSRRKSEKDVVTVVDDDDGMSVTSKSVKSTPPPRVISVRDFSSEMWTNARGSGGKGGKDTSSDDDEDENNTNGVSEAERAKKRHNEEIKRQQEAAKAKGDAEAKEIYEQALKEDPNIFAYDDALTDIEKGREATLREEHGEKIERKSRYIAQLKEAADFRKREQDITYERRLMKEREKEDELYGEKEKFITSAYRKKLEEDEKWKKEELERERREKEREVDGKSDMTSFYANLMNRNVATGGDTATHSRKAPEPKAADSSLVVSQIEKNKEKEIERTITKEKFPKSGIFSDDKKETPMSAIERTVDDKKQLEDQSEDDLRKKSNVGEIAVKKSATIDREEKAKSARERYLARKRKEPS